MSSCTRCDKKLYEHPDKSGVQEAATNRPKVETTHKELHAAIVQALLLASTRGRFDALQVCPYQGQVEEIVKVGGRTRDDHS